MPYIMEGDRKEYETQPAVMVFHGCFFLPLALYIGTKFKLPIVPKK